MPASDLALDLAMALDPAEFSRRAGLDPDPWQAKALRSNAPRILMNCCRQSGKSTITALLAVHTAHYQPGSLVLLLSPSLRQSQELFKKALDVHHAINDDIELAIKADHYRYSESRDGTCQGSHWQDGAEEHVVCSGEEITVDVAEVHARTRPTRSRSRGGLCSRTPNAMVSRCQPGRRIPIVPPSVAATRDGS